jgi:uncharacterized protein
VVPVRVLGLGIGGAQPVVLLTPLDPESGARLVLPIWIGSQEAASIQIAVEGQDPPRPLSHDLMRRLLDSVGASVDRVEVTRIEDGTFYAALHLDTGAGRTVLDCRPSDGIALACRTGSPLFVAEAVLSTAGVYEENDEATAEPTEEDLRQFRQFLDHIEPEDFSG